MKGFVSLSSQKGGYILLTFLFFVWYSFRVCFFLQAECVSLEIFMFMLEIILFIKKFCQITHPILLLAQEYKCIKSLRIQKHGVKYFARCLESKVRKMYETQGNKVFLCGQCFPVICILSNNGCNNKQSLTSQK